MDIAGISFFSALESPPIANKLIKKQTQITVPILEIIVDAMFYFNKSITKFNISITHKNNKSKLPNFKSILYCYFFGKKMLCRISSHGKNTLLKPNSSSKMCKSKFINVNFNWYLTMTLGFWQPFSIVWFTAPLKWTNQIGVFAAESRFYVIQILNKTKDKDFLFLLQTNYTNK